MTHGRVNLVAAILTLLALMAWTIPAGAWIENGSGPGEGQDPIAFGPGGGDGDTDPDDFPIVNADRISSHSAGGREEAPAFPALRAMLAITLELLR